MFHYTYQTKNLVNGKTYIGVHSTSNLEDGYLGSGNALKSSIKKYGKENFKAEILDYFDTKEEAYLEEAFLVTSEVVSNDGNYNLTEGGSGGGNYKGSHKFEGEALEIHRAKAINNWKVEANKMKLNVDVYRDGQFVCTFTGIRETARQLRAPYRSIQKVLRGERTHYKGLTFKTN
jgi:hypothetical protein